MEGGFSGLPPCVGSEAEVVVLAHGAEADVDRPVLRGSGVGADALLSPLAVPEAERDGCGVAGLVALVAVALRVAHAVVVLADGDRPFDDAGLAVCGHRVDKEGVAVRPAQDSGALSDDGRVGGRGHHRVDEGAGLLSEFHCVAHRLDLFW